MGVAMNVVNKDMINSTTNIWAERIPHLEPDVQGHELHKSPCVHQCTDDKTIFPVFAHSPCSQHTPKLPGNGYHDEQ